MKTLTAEELKTLDPKRFEKEYYKWQEYAGDYFAGDYFAEGIQEMFTEDMAKFGVEVEHISYSGFHCQDSHAAFTGRIKIAEWMDSVDGLSTEYVALYLAVLEDGSCATVYTSPRGNMRVDFYGFYDIPPVGVFSGLDQESWGKLLEEQVSDAALDDRLKEWCEDKAKDLYRTLEEAYEWATSEEQFIESCDCNHVTFEIEDEDEDCLTQGD